MKDQSICAQTEHVAKVSSCDQINMPQSLKQSRSIGMIVTTYSSDEPKVAPLAGTLSIIGCQFYKITYLILYANKPGVEGILANLYPIEDASFKALVLSKGKTRSFYLSIFYHENF